MSIEDAIEEFGYAILLKSEGTQTWYMQRLPRFAAWCAAKEIALSQLRPTHVSRYLYELATTPSSKTEEKLSSSTINGHARAIRHFLYWCAEPNQNYIRKVVPEGMDVPRIDEKIIEHFSAQQINAFLHACTKESTPLLIARNKAIIALLVDTGIRAEELCSLERKDVHIMSKEGYIKVQGKGRKEREIPLGAKARQLMHQWLSKYRHIMRSDYTQCFLGRTGNPFTPNGLDQMLYKLADRAKITGIRCSAHTFRHTFAILFLLQGGDIYVLSRLMGHNSVQTTEMYLRAMKSYQARQISKSVLDNAK